MRKSPGFGTTEARSTVAATNRRAGSPAASTPSYDGDPDAVFETEEPPVPQWALDAAAEHDRTDLASAARADSSLHRDAALAAMRALELCDPVVLAEAGHGHALLDGIVAAQRTIARLQALQQRWIAAFSRPGVAVPLRDAVEAAGTSIAEKFGAHLPEAADGETDVYAAQAHPVWGATVVDTASRFAAAEIACATHLAPITARMRLERAREMVDTLPATLAAQEAGLLDGYRAAIIAEGVAALPAALRPRVERKALVTASSCTASELRRRVARAVMAADPAGAAERAARAAGSRHTSVTAIDNDMALFRAVLSAPNALTVHGVLDSVATSLQAAGLAGGRGSAQLRADVLADLFHTLAATGHAYIALPASTDSVDAVRSATGTAPCATGTTQSATTSRPATGALQAVTTAPSATGTALPATHAAPPATTAHHATGTEPSTTTSQSATRASRPATGIAQPATTAQAATTGHAVTGTAPPATGITPCCDGSRPSMGSAPRVSLTVFLDIDTLAGVADHPGEISGYGAVTAGTARALAASADTVRTVVEHSVTSPPASAPRADTGAPVTLPGLVGSHSDNAARSRTCGTVVDPGRPVYRPPQATADYVRGRDRHCQFPGCRTRAERCDIDHRVPYQQGGATCPCNLDALCRAHHRLKTFTSWRAVPDAAGRLVWTSPLGNTYALAPEPTGSAIPVSVSQRLPAIAAATLVPTTSVSAKRAWHTSPSATTTPATACASPGDSCADRDDPPPF